MYLQVRYQDPESPFQHHGSPQPGRQPDSGGISPVCLPAANVQIRPRFRAATCRKKPVNVRKAGQLSVARVSKDSAVRYEVLVYIAFYFFAARMSTSAKQICSTPGTPRPKQWKVANWISTTKSHRHCLFFTKASSREHSLAARSHPRTTGISNNDAYTQSSARYDDVLHVISAIHDDGFHLVSESLGVSTFQHTHMYTCTLSPSEAILLDNYPSL